MIFVLTASAFADRALVASTAPLVTCGADPVAGTFPADGAVGVSPDVAFAVWLGDPTCGPQLVDARFVDDTTGLDVVFAVVTLDPEVVQLVPDAPLAPGPYHVEVTTDWGQALVSFVVDADGALPVSGGIDSLEARLERRCNTFSGAGPAIVGEIGVAQPQSGLLRVRPSTDGIAGAWDTLAVIDASTRTVAFEVPSRAGLHETCIEAEILDERGEIVDAIDGPCFQDRECPPPPSTSLACAHGPGSPMGALALAAILGFRRRRS